MSIFNFKKIFFLINVIFFVSAAYSMEFNGNKAKQRVNNKFVEQIAEQFSDVIFFKFSSDSKLNKLELEEIKDQILDFIKMETSSGLELCQLKDFEDKDDWKVFIKDFVDHILESLNNKFKDKFVIDAELKNNIVVLQMPLLDMIKLTPLDKNLLILNVKSVIKNANKPVSSYIKVKRVGNVVLAIVGGAFVWVVFSFIYQGLGSFDSLPKLARVLFSCAVPLIAIYLTSKIHQFMPDCIKPSKNISKAWNGTAEKDKK